MVRRLPIAKFGANAPPQPQVLYHHHLAVVLVVSRSVQAMKWNVHLTRDMKARRGVANTEVVRRAYLFVARNQTLPPQVRYQAQLQLNTFDRYTHPTVVKNRCAETGRGRGIIGEFALCRVRHALSRFQLRAEIISLVLSQSHSINSATKLDRTSSLELRKPRGKGKDIIPEPNNGFICMYVTKPINVPCDLTAHYQSVLVLQ